MSWFTDNAEKIEKIFTIIVPVIAAAIVGYFSGIFAVQGDLTGLRERTAKLEERLDFVKPSLTEIPKMEKRIISLESELTHVKRLKDIYEGTNRTLEAVLADEKRKTVNELEVLLNKYGQKK